MPEIWLNYGETDVVLDIRAENLDRSIDSGGEALADGAVAERLGAMDLSKPMDLVIQNHTKAVQRIVSDVFALCEHRSAPIPRVLADRQIMGIIKPTLPEGSAMDELSDIRDRRLLFIGEVELDGLFGYETISTRLLRRFGEDAMLSAYSKRNGNLPSPGKPSPGMGEAGTFADGFEIYGIELVASSHGIVDMQVGHPSKTSSISGSLEAAAVQDVGAQKSMIISTGKDASNHTLGKALNSLWSCSAAIGGNGLAILFAESRFGLGSEALRQFIEGRLTAAGLRNPAKYVGGMEDLLFLTESLQSFQAGLVSVLPDLYVKKLGMIPLNGAKPAMDYILKTQGARQKVAVIQDGARVLLRQ